MKLPHKIAHCIPPISRKDKRERKHWNRFIRRALRSMRRNRKARNAEKMRLRLADRELAAMLQSFEDRELLYFDV